MYVLSIRDTDIGISSIVWDLGLTPWYLPFKMTTLSELFALIAVQNMNANT